MYVLCVQNIIISWHNKKKAVIVVAFAENIWIYYVKCTIADNNNNKDIWWYAKVIDLFSANTKTKIVYLEWGNSIFFFCSGVQSNKCAWKQMNQTTNTLKTIQKQFEIFSIFIQPKENNSK